MMLSLRKPRSREGSGFALGAALLTMVLAGSPPAMSQVTWDPPYGCVEEVSGECEPGCDACVGNTCSISTATVKVSVKEQLKADSASAACEEGTELETLRATGNLTVSGWGFSIGVKYVVCEAITRCDGTLITACARCTVVDEMGNFSKDLDEMVCQDRPEGQYQYHIWAFPLNTVLCEDECNNSPHPCADSDCSACSPTEAYAASCCVDVA